MARKKPTPAEQLPEAPPAAEQPETPAAAETERLSAPEIASGLRLTEEQLRVLDDLAAARPVNGRTPGNREVMAALSLKASMSVPKPRLDDGTDERTPIVVLSPFPEPCPFCGRQRE